MAALPLTWLLLAGLAGWLPAPERGGGWWGLRFLSGFAVAVLALFLLHQWAGLGLRSAMAAVAALAVAGLARGGVALWRARPSPAVVLGHPVVALPLLAGAVLAWRGALDYIPLSWDELSNWMAWTRSAFYADRLAGEGVAHWAVGYTPGWAIATLIPNLVTGGFAEARSTFAPFLMHVGLLGLVWDVVTAELRRRDTPPAAAALAAWAVVLAALAVEATWRLVPLNLLIEKPQIYTLSACLLIAFVLLSKRSRQGMAALHLGLIFAFCYLIKVAALAFAGPLALVALLAPWARAEGLRPRRALLGAAAAMVPLAIVYLTWKLAGVDAGGGACMSDPTVVMRDLVSGRIPPGAGDLARRLFGAVAAYALGFKAALSVAALAGFAVALADRRAALVLGAFVLYLGLYFGALYAYHLTCFGEFYFAELNSIDRFTRVPLRVMHLMGLVLPVLALARWPGRLAAGRAGLATLAVAVLVLAGWQVRQVSYSYQAMATRFNETPQWVAEAARVRGDMDQVAALAAGKPPGQGATLLAQGTDGYMHLVARYGSFRHFTLNEGFSFGPNPANIWMGKADSEDVRARLLGSAVVWPLVLDEWMLAQLAALIDDPACRDDPTNWLLVPQDGRLVCRPKGPVSSPAGS